MYMWLPTPGLKLEPKTVSVVENCRVRHLHIYEMCAAFVMLLISNILAIIIEYCTFCCSSCGIIQYDSHACNIHSITTMATCIESTTSVRVHEEKLLLAL